jgi:dienelactone hydrolase
MPRRLRNVCVIAIAILSIIFLFTPTSAQTFGRMEVRAVDSVTLTGEQFLMGDTNGKPARLAGELRLPAAGLGRLPAVILVHGSGGLSASEDRWAQELNGIGVAVFLLDTFSGRGIVSTASDQSQLHSLAMMVDAYRALASLAGHARIDPNRIAVMGFSKGAVAAVYSSNERFRKLHGSGQAQFSAHIGLYTPCNTQFSEDEKTSGKPIRLFHGAADDYVAVAPCREYVERLKQAGADVTLTEYPGAYHAYDMITIRQQIKIPTAQTTRNCSLEEGPKGQTLNSKTKQPFDMNDTCVEKGAMVGYNAPAHEATVKDVKEFLKATFGLK